MQLRTYWNKDQGEEQIKNGRLKEISLSSPQEIGLASLGASEEDIVRLATV